MPPALCVPETGVVSVLRSLLRLRTLHHTGVLRSGPRNRSTSIHSLSCIPLYVSIFYGKDPSLYPHVVGPAPNPSQFTFQETVDLLHWARQSRHRKIWTRNFGPLDLLSVCDPTKMTRGERRIFLSSTEHIDYKETTTLPEDI